MPWMSFAVLVGLITWVIGHIWGLLLGLLLLTPLLIPAAFAYVYIVLRKTPTP